MFIDNNEQKELDLASTLNTSTKSVQKPNTKSIQGWRRGGVSLIKHRLTTEGGVSLIKHRLTTETIAQQMDTVVSTFFSMGIYISRVFRSVPHVGDHVGPHGGPESLIMYRFLLYF